MADDLQERASFLARFSPGHEPELIRRVKDCDDFEVLARSIRAIVHRQVLKK